jgi:hypothetical protein
MGYTGCPFAEFVVDICCCSALPSASFATWTIRDTMDNHQSLPLTFFANAEPVHKTANKQGCWQ